MGAMTPYFCKNMGANQGGHDPPIPTLESPLVTRHNYT